MNTLSLLSITAFIIYFCAGVHILFVEVKSKSNILFFFICLSLAVWALSGFFGFSAPHKDVFLVWFRIGWFGALSFWAFFLHFHLSLTGVVRVKPLLYGIVYLPAVVLAVVNATTLLLYRDFVQEGGQWIFIPDYDSPWSYFYLAYNTACIILSVIVLVVWRTKSETIREKRISRILIAGILVTFMVGSAEFLLPGIVEYRSPGPSPLVFVITIACFFYAIVRYRFMAITPEFVSKEILENIDELIILLDSKCRVIMVNKQASEKLTRFPGKAKNAFFSDMVIEKESFSKEFENLKRGEYRDFSSRVHFIKCGGERFLADVKCSAIRSPVGDIMGILVIAKEVRELKRFQEDYKITKKQAEIIQYMITGKTNKEIAALIGVSCITVKGHISHIYSKLDVRNKMQLLNLLRDYHLIPERNAEKIFLALRRS